MKTLFAFDLFPIRNSLTCYNWVNDEFLGIFSRVQGMPYAWGDVEPRLLLSKQEYNGTTSPVILLPDNLREKLNGFCGVWNEDAVERWKQLMLGRGDAADVVCEALQYAYKKFAFDQIVYWGTNRTIKNFASSVGARSVAMELGPTRYPFEETRYCDFAGVNGDAFTLNLKVADFEPMDLSRWRKENGIFLNSGEGYGPLASVHADVIERHSKPMAVIALQLDDDANSLLYSDYSGMAEMVRSVVPRLVEKGWMVAVKPHPLANPDVGDAVNRQMNVRAHQECRAFIESSFDESEVFWLDDIRPACYKTMLSKIDALICVNSSAGFEAMLMGKPVVFLGRAPFNMTGLLTLNDLIDGYDSEAYSDNVSRVANVMLNYYLYPKWQMQNPRGLVCALNRTRRLEEAADKGSTCFRDALIANPVWSDARAMSALAASVYSESEHLRHENARKDAQLATRDAQLVDLRAKLCLVNAEKYRIQHQYWDLLADEKYRVYTKICNCIDAVIPKDSGRRNLVKGAYYGLKWFYKRFKNPEVNRKPVDQALKSIARPDESRKIKTFGTLEVPRCEDPVVSIVIPVYNQFAYTYCCIRSVIANSGEIPYEVIIADDCSTDQTVDAARYIKNVRVVRTKENLRFLRNCNNAAKQVRGRYILFLNNDTVVHKGWLKSLVDLCERDPKVGVTGSKLVYSDGVLQEAGGILWRDGSAWNFGRGKNPFDSEYCYVKECDYISGAALMVRKALWNEVGGFDERFAPAYYEDTDFCFEARKHGYKVVFQPASLVTHFEGRSNGTDVAAGLKKYQVDNQKKFYEKWQSVLEEHAPNGVDVFTARDRSARRQHVFLVDHYIPTFDKDAGGRQIYFYLKTLAEMGFQVHLLGDNSCHDEPYTSTFQQMGIEVLYGKRFCPLNREAWFMENGKYLDFAFLHRPHIAINYINMVRSNTNAKIIFFGADVGQVRIKREYEITGRQALLNELKLVKQQEDLLYGAADVNLCVGSADADFVRKTYPGHPVFNIPLFIYDNFREESPGFKERKDIMFVGGFCHRPNVDAVQWFVKEIFPKIVNACPDVKFHVVGSNVPSDIKGLASEQVIIEGFLPDEKLWELYDKCRLTIAPLRYGAGVKGKVIDAMYFRSVVVTTSIGAEGIPQEPMPFAIADDAAKFADAVITLYQDAEAWEKLHRDSLEMIKANYSLAKAKSLLNQIFTK